MAKHQSIWIHDQPDFDDFIDSDVDVIVVGGGIFGLLTAYRLIESGLKPAIIEASKIGLGTSGHTTGKITSQHGMIYGNLIKRFGKEKAKAYALANESAIEDYARIIKSENIKCGFVREPSRIFLEDKHLIQELRDEYDAAISVGINCSLVRSFLGDAIEFRDQAMFQPYDFMVCLANAIRKKGGSITEKERVLKYSDDGDYCVVKTDKGTYRSRYIVLATLAPINENSFYSLRIRPIEHHAIAFESSSNLDAMYLKMDSPTISFRKYDDYIIAVGENMYLGHATEDVFSKLEKEARKRLDLGQVVYTWSAHDLETVDNLPLAGTLSPTSKKIFTATGFRAWGLTQSMVASKAIVGLINSNKENIYSPWRLKGSVKDFFNQSKHVAKHLVKSGKRCTHMGCSLNWNERENTYDCSCHGSRFDKRGNVVVGPATKKLTIDKDD